MNIQSITQTIESLPPLSNSTIFVQKLYAEGAENVDISKLIRIIESDAMLSVNILKMINAPAFGFSKKIASVSQAVTLFGTRTVYGLVMKYSILEVIKADTSVYAISSKKFNDVCHIQSALMMQWYSKVDLRHAQFLAPLALMMESGKLLIAKALKDNDSAESFKVGLQKAKNKREYEFSTLGTTSYFVSGLLFEHWNLEPLYVDMLKGLDFKGERDPQMNEYINTLNIVRLAVNVRSILTSRSINNACRTLEDLDLDTSHFRRVANRIKETYENS